MHLEAAQSSQSKKSLATGMVGEVYFEDFDRSLYSTDASIYRIEPLAVVVPRTQADVAHAVRWAAEFGVPIIPRGSGTSLSGQSIGQGLVIDFSKWLNRILEIDVERRTARVEPGVVLDQLNAAAAKHGLQFGPEVATSSRANLGGMIGNNSAGSRSILHGKTVDHVLALDVLLADGTPVRFEPKTADEIRAIVSRDDALARVYREAARIARDERDEIIARFPRVLRRVSGYNLDELVPECRSGVRWPPLAEAVRAIEHDRFPDAPFNLARLIVGSEGTLATVTEALVHLVPAPAVRAIVVLEFDSLEASVGAVGEMLTFGPSAVEMLDGLIIELAAKNLEYKHYLDFVVGRPESLLIVEFAGDDMADVRHRAEQLALRMQGWAGIARVLPAFDKAMCDHIWACRKAALPLLMSIPGSRKPIAFVEDTAVDPSRLPEFVARFRRLIERHDTRGAFYGHASVGCLHIRPLLDCSRAEDVERIRAISAEVAELVQEFGGAMSGEHGDGLARSYLNERMFGPRIYQAFRALKRAFDPRHLMNPGKIVDAPGPTENLRLGPSYRPISITTTLDFSREGGLAQAAEACNGSGVCRKTRTGTMCPSFMATGDEEHSTRGRANALRMVLSGGLPAAELTGSRLLETFELCLQCKGCKAECPSNVDVAKMKVELLDHYYQAHGTPRSARFMGHVARWNKLGSALAPLSNWLTWLPGVGLLNEHLLGIDRRRPLPHFEHDNFHRWFARHRPANSTSDAPRTPVVLLDDCLTSYCEPNVNRAAVELLERAGHEVHLAGLGCCGRAMISKGLVREAQQLARANIARLLPWAQRGVSIVGCEPSCLLTLVDEYRDLVPGSDAELIAQQARLIDTHLVRSGVQLPWQEGAEPAQALLHGHCHQKALVGLADTRAALSQVPGLSTSVVDSGCCGMAGSFGYEHYDLSMQIGERVLFPAVRSQPEALLIAPGFSCRQQIQHATGRRALHPAELLAERVLPLSDGPASRS